MDEREKEMYENIRKENHRSAQHVLLWIKWIKENCKNRRCEDCRFFNEKERYYNTCVLGGNEELSPEEWDIYDIVERIYK